VFVNALINFLFVAFALFLVIQGHEPHEAAGSRSAPGAPQPTPQEKLLAEIRDLLRKK